MKNYYDILGITSKASDQDIKRAYRSLAMRYHPDRNKAPGAHESFLTIQEAYNTLSDPIKRSNYDYYASYSTNTTTSSKTYSYNNSYTTTQNSAQAFRERAEAEARKRRENEIEFERRKQHSKAEKKRKDADLFVFLRGLNYVCLVLSLFFFLDISLPKTLSNETVMVNPTMQSKNYHTDDNSSFRFTEDGAMYLSLGDRINIETTPIFGFVYKIKSVNSEQVTTDPSIKWGPHSIFYLNVLVLIFCVLMELNWLKHPDYDVLIPTISFTNVLILVTEVFMIVDIMA